MYLTDSSHYASPDQGPECPALVSSLDRDGPLPQPYLLTTMHNITENYFNIKQQNASRASLVFDGNTDSTWKTAIITFSKQANQRPLLSGQDFSLRSWTAPCAAIQPTPRAVKLRHPDLSFTPKFVREIHPQPERTPYLHDPSLYANPSVRCREVTDLALRYLRLAV